MRHPPEVPCQPGNCGDSIPRVDLFGLTIAQLDLQGLLEYFDTSIRSGRDRPSVTKLIAYANAHTCNLFQQNATFRRALQQVDLVYADGNGPRFAAWLSGQWLPRRMTSADWYPELCRLCEMHGYSMFLLGAAPGVATRAAQQLRNQHPELLICGTHHGYFTPEEGPQVVQLVLQAHPDLLVLGMGSPRQEVWMVQHRENLRVPVIWAAGGWFDLVAGTTPRAPAWMRRLALEWLWRMLMEPRRLGPRYLVGIPVFLWRSLRHGLRRRLQAPIR